MCTCKDTLTLHRYKREFGFTIPERSVIVDDIRVRGTAKAFSHQPHKLPAASTTPKVASVSCCVNIYTDLMLQPTFTCACTCTVPCHSTCTLHIMGSCEYSTQNYHLLYVLYLVAVHKMLL